MRGTWYPNAEEHPPSPPLKGGEGEAKRWEKSEHKVRPLRGISFGSLIPFRPVA